jgi:hypothetical protein
VQGEITKVADVAEPKPICKKNKNPTNHRLTFNQSATFAYLGDQTTTRTTNDTSDVMTQESLNLAEKIKNL